MSWQQVKGFNLSKMGTTPGMCLQNVRLAFGIGPKYASAKDAMIANRNAGTLHDISTLPKNVAVPVFVDTSSVYEHVEAADCGVFYSDGKRVSNPYSQRFFGWGETLNDERVVKWVEDPKPTPTLTPTPGINVGDKVTLKNWVDYNGTPLKQTRDYYFVSQINGDRAVLNADSVNGAVYCAANTNNLVKTGGTPAPSGAIGVGDKVTLTNYVDYNGTPLKKTRDFYYVTQLNGDRAVLNADSMTGPVYAAVNTRNLRKV